MANYNYRILKEYNKRTVVEYLEAFHLGNEKIKQIKTNGKILINDNIRDINSILFTDDILTLELNEVSDVIPYKAKINILYEDDYLLIINKPIGIVVHSDGNQKVNNTLDNYVASYYVAKGYDFPIRHLHRLDEFTSGLIIYCKDILTMSEMSYLLSTHDFRREYYALAQGVIKDDAVINLPIGRDRHINGKYRVSDSGKEAITNMRVVKKFSKYTLVELSLETGRTHQIRVHMSYISHPLLGDTLYGGNDKYIKRQALHSYHTAFKHPITNELIDVYCKLPKDMEVLIK